MRTAIGLARTGHIAGGTPHSCHAISHRDNFGSPNSYAMHASPRVVLQTIQEIADEVGVAKVTVFEHVGVLIKKGVLEREPHKARSLSVAEGVALPDQENALSFPLVGRIAAGHPIEQYEQRDTLDLESVFGPRVGTSGTTFALQVTGLSMQDEGILDGDYIIVRQTSTGAPRATRRGAPPQRRNNPQDLLQGTRRKRPPATSQR